jgi:chloramphenicol 3-O-phosphotransferase
MEPHIILLNGPAGVGKSSVAAHLAVLAPGSVSIRGDDLRAFAPADARTHLGPGSTYRAGATLAAAYLDMGAPRVIFEYVFEGPSQVELFRRAVPSLPVYLFTLWAPLEVIQAREEQRPNRRRLGGRVEGCYRALEANLEQLGVVVPTTDLSPEQVAQTVSALLADRTAALPDLHSSRT